MAFGFSRKMSKSSAPKEAITAVSSANSSVDATNRAQDKSAVPTEDTLQQVGASVNDIYGGNLAAKSASEHEQNMSMSYTIRHYYIALLWAALMAAPIIMEGYETAMVPNFFSYHNFQTHYGNKVARDLSIVPPGWQSGITIAAACGQLCGLWLAPRLVNRVGYRVCTISGLTWASACLIIGFFSYSAAAKARLPVFLVGELLLGVPWGLFQGLTLPYVSDITPLKLKGPATTMINVFWLIGQLIAAGVLRGASEITDPSWSVRAPLLIQYSWIIPLILMAFLAPESPLYLSRRDKDTEALRVLRRVNKDPLFDENGALAMLHAVNEHEKETSQQMGLRNCFKGTNLRRTEIAVVIYLTQQLVGSPLIFYSVKVLQKGGLSQSCSLYVTIGMYALCIMSTLSSMAAMRAFARRTMWIGGLIAEITCLAAIGVLGFHMHEGNDNTQPVRTSVSWAIATFLVLFAIIYNFTIGPVCYAIVAETPSTRLKAATNSVARGIYIAVSMANLFLVPNLLEDEPAGWGLGAKAALVWAVTSGLCLVWAWFRLPEMKDRTPAQIDVMFEKKLSARAWSSAKF